MWHSRPGCDSSGGGPKDTAEGGCATRRPLTPALSHGVPREREKDRAGPLARADYANAFSITKISTPVTDTYSHTGNVQRDTRRCVASLPASARYRLVRIIGT